MNCLRNRTRKWTRKWNEPQVGIIEITRTIDWKYTFWGSLWEKRGGGILLRWEIIWWINRFLFYGWEVSTIILNIKTPKSSHSSICQQCRLIWWIWWMAVKKETKRSPNEPRKGKKNWRIKEEIRNCFRWFKKHLEKEIINSIWFSTKFQSKKDRKTPLKQKLRPKK